MLQLDFICHGADHQDMEKTKPEENTEQREMWCFPLWTTEGLTLREGGQMRGSAGGQVAAFAVVPEPGWCSLQLPWERRDFWRALPGPCAVPSPLARPRGPALSQRRSGPIAGGLCRWKRSPVSAKARQGPGLLREFQAALCSQWKMASSIDFYSSSLKLYLFKSKQDLFLPRSDLACFAASSPISPSDACDCQVPKGGLNEADVQGGRGLRFSAGRHLSQLALRCPSPGAGSRRFSVQHLKLCYVP